jgi:hypothetical protein
MIRVEYDPRWGDQPWRGWAEGPAGRWRRDCATYLEAWIFAVQAFEKELRKWPNLAREDAMLASMEPETVSACHCANELDYVLADIYKSE